MTTNAKINEKLIQEALQLGGHLTKSAVIEEALQEYVQHPKQLEVVRLFRTIEYDDDYDYKLQRQKQ
ncbi:type II toxin-antitoxin system VapB family antitoxin [Pleurocapsales cyanobacterium LEGE 06147]|nr:type II toxin-antitoxin system VapB family antitoxin [Pleurocapsales cyanobacterium LEGE 06147]